MIAKPNRMLVVSYDLKGPGTYAQFYEALKQQGSWSRYLPAMWLIYTQKTPAEVVAAIRPHMQEASDHVFVGALEDGYSGWLPQAAWDWIKDKGLLP